MSQPFRAGLTFAVGPFDKLRAGSTGLHAQTASSKNISRTSLQNCRSLGFARDDKGEGDASICIWRPEKGFMVTLCADLCFELFRCLFRSPGASPDQRYSA